MRLILSYFALLFLVIALGCKSNNLSGVYVCDQSQIKPDTTIIKESSAEIFMDLTCIIQELNFKGNSTVEIKMQNGPIVTSYVVDKEYIRVKGSTSDILFKVINKKTLAGEGVFKGLYHKQ